MGRVTGSGHAVKWTPKCKHTQKKPGSALTTRCVLSESLPLLSTRKCGFAQLHKVKLLCLVASSGAKREAGGERKIFLTWLEKKKIIFLAPLLKKTRKQTLATYNLPKLPKSRKQLLQSH